MLRCKPHSTIKPRRDPPHFIFPALSYTFPVRPPYRFSRNLNNQNLSPLPLQFASRSLLLSLPPHLHRPNKSRLQRPPSRPPNPPQETGRATAAIPRRQIISPKLRTKSIAPNVPPNLQVAWTFRQTPEPAASIPVPYSSKSGSLRAITPTKNFSRSMPPTGKLLWKSTPGIKAHTRTAASPYLEFRPTFSLASSSA